MGSKKQKSGVDAWNKKGGNRAHHPGNSTVYKRRQKEMDKETMNIQNNQKANKMAIESSYIAIIILNVNRLNSSNKRHRVAQWRNKQDPTMYCV